MALPSLFSVFLFWHFALLQPNSAQPAPSSLPTIAGIVGEPSVFALHPENVRERFASLVPLNATVTTNVLHRYVGHNAAKGIYWVMADFQPSIANRKQWTLLQLQICIDGSGSVEAAMRSNLTRKLGRPKSEGDRFYWELGDHREISLKSGSFQPPEGGPSVSGVLIEAVVLQGEPE
ncbi:MAG TPA: hypothetical protein VG168_13050 [Bryobacteraceae bacterium]|jgi:hypothetical protein|nr:hypothetical protein [Bryobacteraceae bacterium]